MVGLLPHSLRLNTTLLSRNSAAVVADRMVMADSLFQVNVGMTAVNVGVLMGIENGWALCLELVREVLVVFDRKPFDPLDLF